jgi:hypothetical protein
VNRTVQQACDSPGFDRIRGGQAAKLGNSTALARRPDGGGIGALPSSGHQRDDHVGVEHPERGGNHGAGHLTQHRHER